MDLSTSIPEGGHAVSDTLGMQSPSSIQDTLSIMHQRTKGFAQNTPTSSSSTRDVVDMSNRYLNFNNFPPKHNNKRVKFNEGAKQSLKQINFQHRDSAANNYVINKFSKQWRARIHQVTHPPKGMNQTIRLKVDINPYMYGDNRTSQQIQSILTTRLPLFGVSTDFMHLDVPTLDTVDKLDTVPVNEMHRGTIFLAHIGTLNFYCFQYRHKPSYRYACTILKQWRLLGMLEYVDQAPHDSVHMTCQYIAHGTILDGSDTAKVMNLWPSCSLNSYLWIILVRRTEGLEDSEMQCQYENKIHMLESKRKSYYIQKKIEERKSSKKISPQQLRKLNNSTNPSEILGDLSKSDNGTPFTYWRFEPVVWNKKEGLPKWMYNGPGWNGIAMLYGIVTEPPAMSDRYQQRYHNSIQKLLYPNRFSSNQKANFPTESLPVLPSVHVTYDLGA